LLDSHAGNVDQRPGVVMSRRMSAGASRGMRGAPRARHRSSG
jgi:hypothetical protein